MILYHGTYMDFTAIDLSKSKLHKDFGQGFYLTDIKDQAERMAEKKARLYDGIPTVQAYSFDETSLQPGHFQVLRFDAPTKEWAEFIYKNRSRQSPAFKHDYDIVIGPIADDGVAYLLEQYDDASLTLEQLAEKLKYKHLNKQYFFGTETAIKLLTRL